VLVVDDNPDIVATAVALLRVAGYETKDCDNGTDVLDCVKEHDPDVVLLDIDLPGLSGWEVARKIREQGAAIRQPIVIAITGEYIKDVDKRLGDILGFDFFLLKPADPNALLALIKKATASPSSQAHMDSQVGLPTFGINLIARPRPLVSEKFSAIQDALSLAIPKGVLYRCPLSSLHLSVFQFVWARRIRESAADESVWSGYQNHIVERLNAVASSTDAFAVGRPRILAGESAVILRFDPSPVLEALRDDISSIAGLGGLSTNRPTIQHVSIFRYDQEVAVNPIQQACNNVHIPHLVWTIDQLELVREKVYPSLELDVIRTFRLRRGVS
jgi:CheY-like chemotaxis protein